MTSKVRKRRTPGHWQASFLSALREGRCIREACSAAGISYTLAYNERQRDTNFAQAWEAILSPTWREWQLPYQWCPTFLETLAATGQVALACEAAGIGRSAAYYARRSSVEMAIAWNEALISYLKTHRSLPRQAHA